MNDTLKEILQQVASGSITPERAYDELKSFEDLGYAKVDHQRSKRQGFPEVVFGQGKTAEQIISIFRSLMKQNPVVLGTRVSRAKAKIVTNALPEVVYHETAKILLYQKEEVVPKCRGIIGILCAGTSDLFVAEEAYITARAMGNEVRRFYDVGVAGLHRLLHQLDEIKRCRVLIVIAGMEGALPSVVGGLVSQPVIAVPTSIGYGANLGGLTPLLTMLNSCASGVTVVNINNGFGAAYCASLINQIGD
jgi:hypothetical protein